MASTVTVRLVTPRDLDLFQALDRCPLTVAQVLKVSQTFAYPFTTERRVQERLHELVTASRVRQCSISSSSVTAPPGTRTTTASGVSTQRGWGIPT